MGVGGTFTLVLYGTFNHMNDLCCCMTMCCANKLVLHLPYTEPMGYYLVLYQITQYFSFDLKKHTIFLEKVTLTTIL